MNLAWWSVKARGGVGLMAVASATVFCGCTSLASGSDTAATAPDPRWACLDTPEPPLPMLDPQTQSIAYLVPVFDFTNSPASIPGVELELCKIADRSCPGPDPKNGGLGVVKGPFSYPTKFQGFAVTVPLYAIITKPGVDLFIRVTAPNYLTLEYYLGGRLLGSPPIPGADPAAMPSPELQALVAMLPPNTAIVTGLPIAPLAIADADALGAKIGQARDPKAAIVAIRTLDCTNDYASGVKLTIAAPPSDGQSAEQPSGVPFTFLSGQPKLAGNQPTDSRGLAGFANVGIPQSAGSNFTNVTIEGVAPNGVNYGSINVTITAGQVTLASTRYGNNSYGF